MIPHAVMTFAISVPIAGTRNRRRIIPDRLACIAVVTFLGGDAINAAVCAVFG